MAPKRKTRYRRQQQHKGQAIFSLATALEIGSAVYLSGGSTPIIMYKLGKLLDKFI